jgi:hypothetical protein
MRTKLDTIRFAMYTAIFALANYSVAYAGWVDSVKGWFGDQLVAIIAVLIAGLTAKILGERNERVARTMMESGEAITQMGKALLTQDQEEAKKVVDEIKDVFDPAKVTPGRYKAPTSN